MIRILRLMFICQIIGSLSSSASLMAEAPSTPEDKGDSKREWGAVVGGQAISIAVKKATFAPEEAIVLDIVLKNIGKDDVRVVDIDRDKKYRLSVLLPNGEEAPLTLFGKSVYEKRHGPLRGCPKSDLDLTCLNCVLCDLCFLKQGACKWKRQYAKPIRPT